MINRKAAFAALKTVEGVDSNKPKDTLTFVSVVADGVVNAYRSRCE